MDEKVLQRRPSDVFLAMVQERAADDSFDYFSQLVETWAQIRDLEAMATRERFLADLRALRPIENLREMGDPSSGASRHLPPEGKALREMGDPSSGASRHLPPEGKALRETGDPSSGASRHLPPEGKALRPCEGDEGEDPSTPLRSAQDDREAGGKSTPKSTPGEGEKVHVDDVEKVHAEGVENTPDRGGDPVQNGPAKKRDEADIGRRSLATRKRKIYEAVDRLRAEGTPMQTIADAAPGLNFSDVMDAVERKPLALPRLGLLEKAVRKLEGENG